MTLLSYVRQKIDKSMKIKTSIFQVHVQGKLLNPRVHYTSEHNWAITVSSLLSNQNICTTLHNLAP